MAPKLDCPNAGAALGVAEPAPANADGFVSVVVEDVEGGELNAPKADGFDSEALGVPKPKADRPWSTNAANPVAGFNTPDPDPSPKPLVPKADEGFVVSVEGVAKEPNMLFVFGASVLAAFDPPRDKPPIPASVSTSADIGSSEFDMEMAMGDAREVPSCKVLGGARLPPKPSWPNFEGPADANAPNPPLTGP